jgi:acyl-CoA synthetase (AMP-forming)/AMP-acid ligase II
MHEGRTRTVIFMRTLGDVAREGATAHGDRTAVVFEETRLTYRELDARVNRLANALIRLGCQRGARLAVLAENTHKYMEVYLAAGKAGLAVTPLNFRLSDAEIVHIVTDGEATVFMAGEGYEERALRLEEELGHVAHWIALDAASNRHLSYEDLLRDAPDTDPFLPVDENEMAILMYTGGTTGAPKGVMLSHKNLLVSARACAAGVGLDHRDIECYVLPLFHVAMWAALCTAMAGATLVIVRRPELEQILGLIQKERCTHVNLVPTLLGWMLSLSNLDDFDLSSLRLISYAGSPMAPEVLKAAIRKFGNIFVQGYGMTEAAPAVSFLREEDHVLEGPRARILTSAGKAAPGVEVRVVDDDGEPVAPGEIGEISVRGDNVMLGYWKNPELSAEALRGGWLHTGDMGTLDGEGYIFLKDRKADMIVTGGENVYPKETEDVLYEHPAIQECAVASAPDARWGEKVQAAVALKAGHSVDENELIEHCKRRLAGYKCPKAVEIWDELPKTPIGKILRKDVKRRFWQGAGRSIG